MKAQTMFLCKKASEFSASHYCIITQRIQGVELGKPFSLDLNQQRTNPKMLDIGMYIVPIVHCCQYLGVTLDQELTFASHIHRIYLLSCDAYHQSGQHRTVVHSLTPDATATLIHAFITACLDHCCSLYAGFQVGRIGCNNNNY